MSEFATHVFEGVPQSDEDWNNFLLDCHNSKPGKTPLAFDPWKTADGMTSYDLLVDIAKNVRPPDGHPLRLLDLACGDGYLIELCLDRMAGNARILGIDMSVGELTAARRRLGGRDIALSVERAQQLSLPDHSVDVVLCHMAFMLMAPVEPVVSEIARVLRPGGVFAAVIGSSTGLIDGMRTKPYAFHPTLAAEAQTEMRRFWAEEFPNMSVYSYGDPRVMTVSGLEQLFSTERGFSGSVDVYDFDVLTGTSAEALWSLFGDTYLASRLDPERKARLRARLDRLFMEREGAGRSLNVEFTLRRFSVRTQN